MPKKTTGEPEVASVLWIEHGHHIEVAYVDGHADRRQGDQVVATELAEGAGLEMVHTPKGMVRWVRDPDPWQTVNRKPPTRLTP